jgi:hypothetical protein
MFSRFNQQWCDYSSLFLAIAKLFPDAAGSIVNRHSEAIPSVAGVVVDTNKPLRSKIKAFSCLVNMANGQI